MSQFATGNASAGSTLFPWQPGNLDIHHINTGRGNSTLVLMPDGTSLLVDAGASGTHGPAMNPSKPDDSRRAGEWIARYVARQLKATSRASLNYALMTHFHGDHVGDPRADCPTSIYGNYKLTGISEVAEVIEIEKLIDRGFPDYSYPQLSADPAAVNYAAFARSAATRGTTVQRVNVGSSRQIVPVGPNRSTDFVVRIIAGNGQVWTGEDEASRSMFPSQAGLRDVQLASENSCSVALRLSYGRFTYFTGGDLNCDTNYGRDPWRDVETAASKSSGPVSVATCNHHGYFDASGPESVRTLRPRVWVLQSWHASHPAMSVLSNLYSPILYPGPRDVFSLGLHPAAELVCARFSDQFKSKRGHVLVRVTTGGAEYSTIVIEDGDESDRILAAFGPYTS